MRTAPLSAYELERQLQQFVDSDRAGENRGVEHSATKSSATKNSAANGGPIYVLLDGAADFDQFQQQATRLINAHPDWIQFRDKQLDDRKLLHRARWLRQTLADTPIKLIINDRVDLALLSDADGVHVGQEELTVGDVRKLAPDLIVGVSTHTVQQAHQAIAEGADYIGCGPVFPSQTKSFAEFPGLELLRQLHDADDFTFPTFAIGGIKVDNVSQVRETGCTRVAVARGVTGQTDMAASITKLRQQLK